MVQIRNVPSDLHRVLKARAALEGMSLSDYLLREVRQSLERPTVEEIRRRLAGRIELERILGAAGFRLVGSRTRREITVGSLRRDPRRDGPDLNVGRNVRLEIVGRLPGRVGVGPSFGRGAVRRAVSHPRSFPRVRIGCLLQRPVPDWFLDRISPRRQRIALLRVRDAVTSGQVIRLRSFARRG